MRTFQFQEEENIMVWQKLFLPIILSLALAGCGGGAQARAGDPASGKVLFNHPTIVSVPGCVICHAIEPGPTKAGPNLAGIASAAGTRVKGQNAEAYLRAAILDPEAVKVEGFPAGIMPATFKDVLSEQQVSDLVAYILTLK